MIAADVDIFLGLNVGENRPLGLRRRQGRHQNLEQDPAQRRRQTRHRLTKPQHQGHRAGRRGPAGHHRCAGRRRRPEHGNPRRLFARVVDAAHRRYVSRYGENRRKDAFIIADAARTMPHTLRSLQVSDEDEVTLGMLTGFDLDLARQIKTVIVVGTDAAGLVIPHLARQLISLHAQRVDVASHLEAMVEAHLFTRS